MKSSCRRVTSCSMWDLDSATKIKSSIKDFIDGPIISLVLTLVLCNIIYIAKTKSSGEITHPIIMPIFNSLPVSWIFIIRKPHIGIFKVCWYEVFNVLWNPLFSQVVGVLLSHMRFLDLTRWCEIWLIYNFFPFLFGHIHSGMFNTTWKLGIPTFCIDVLAYSNSITLSKHVWRIKDVMGKSFMTKWDIMKKTQTYEGGHYNSDCI